MDEYTMYFCSGRLFGRVRQYQIFAHMLDAHCCIEKKIGVFL